MHTTKTAQIIADSEESNAGEHLLTRHLLISQLRVMSDRRVSLDPAAQTLFGLGSNERLEACLERIEPVELHRLIGKVDIDSEAVLIKDSAGVYRSAKLWQYRCEENAEWQIAIQTESHNASDENPFKQRHFSQQQLLSIISHELRTPVATLKMLIDELNSSNFNEQLPLLRETSDHLMSVLQDMRQAISPEKNLPFRSRRFHPNRLLENVTSQVRRMAEAAGIKLRMQLLTEEQLFIETDLERCKLIAINLLKNAVVHSGADEVTIEIEISKPDAEHASMLMRVRDNGAGIPDVEIDRLQQPFERLQGLEQGGSGSGLGLFVVKRTAIELGGNFKLENSPGGGLTATASIPYKRSSLTNEPLTTSHQESLDFQQRLSQMRVLVVEDDPVIRMVSQKLLAKRVKSVDTAENGATGLAKILEQEYDLVLSDYFMPVLDGAAMIRQARAAGITTPILSVTAAVLGDEAQELLEAGANQILAKPISMKAFIEAVEQL